MSDVGPEQRKASHGKAGALLVLSNQKLPIDASLFGPTRVSMVGRGGFFFLHTS